ncbi:hypothetical protein BM1_10514 [Bipolaris maydis]|nr:hypothetical protein BM1_10514 [Bipolaris maydis]
MLPQRSITGDHDAYSLALRDAQYFKMVGFSLDTVRGRIRKQQHPAAKFTSKSLKKFCHKVIEELKAQNAAQEQQPADAMPPVPASQNLDFPTATIQGPSHSPAKKKWFLNSDWEPKFSWAQMHDIRISMPFLGSGSETHQSRLEKLGLPPDWRHDGMPVPGQEFARLYEIQLQEAPLRSFKSYQLGGSDHIRMAIPIRLRYGVRNDCNLTTQDHFALWIQFDNGSHTILPIALWVSGSRNCSLTRYGADAKQIFSDAHREIRAFFQDAHWPMIAISDVVFTVGSTNVKDFSVWQPRVFEDVWYFVSASNGVHVLPQTTLHFLKPYLGWQRYRDARKLLANFTSVARYAYLDKLPSEPFDILSISNIQLTNTPCYPPCPTVTPEIWILNEETDEFELEAEFNEFYTEDTSKLNDTHPDLRSIDDETDIAIKPHRAAYPVDDAPSCAAFFRCTSRPIPISTFCQIHWERFMSLKESNRISASIPIPSFHLPVNKAKREMLKALIELVDKKTFLWLTDSEFTINKGMAPSVFQVCVKKFGSNQGMINTNIHYPGFDLVACNKILNPRFPRTFERIYGSDRQTNGITLPQLGAKLRENGFDYHNHAILSWFSMADMTSIVRALCGHTSLLEAQEKVRIPRARSKWRGFQPINVGDIIRSMITLQAYNLQHVHRAFCPESTLFQFHYAKTDVLALEEIMLVVVKKGKELLQ